MFPHTDDNPLESSSIKKQLYYDQNPISFFDQLPLNSDQIRLTKMKGKAAEMSNSPPRRGVIPRKRTGKKDRHSKIRTAQGIRDRRMRLSLQVARKFFDLQDMLGYDKASKTIEWLFCKSNMAIKDLTTSTDEKTESSFISECEVVSGIEENSNMVVNTNPEKKARSGKPNYDARESRERARERARCRTREKMMIKLGWSFDQDLGHHDDYATAAADNCPAAEDVGTIEKLLLGNSSNCSAPPVDAFMGNWDLQMNNDRFQLMAVTNHLSLPGNSTSFYTSDFPFFLQHHNYN